MALEKNTALNVREALLRGQSFGSESLAPQLDLSKSALHGYQPQFGNYISNTGHRPSPIIPFLLEAPRGFAHLPNPDKARAALKQLMTTQAKSITGLRSGYNVEASDRQISHAGHMHSDPTKVTEEMSVVNYTWDERLGKPIQTFWMHFIRNLIADPVTTQPGIMTLGFGGTPTDMAADMYSFTMLFVEPDPLKRFVVEAWLVNGMWPTTSGVLESQYDPTAGADVPEIAIEFKGTPVSTFGVRQLAQAKLDKVNWINAGHQHQPAWLTAASADVTSADGGWTKGVAAAQASGKPIGAGPAGDGGGGNPQSSFE